MGFEPTTPTLARLCSTPELHPHNVPGSWFVTASVGEVGSICTEPKNFATGKMQDFDYA